MLATQQVAAAIDSIASDIGLADSYFDRHLASGDDEWHVVASNWHLELAYTKLLVLTEALHLPILRADISAALELARSEGFSASELDPDCDPQLKWASPARRYLRAVQSAFAIDSLRTVTKDLEAILRESIYSIVDRRVFSAPPDGEPALHDRLEAILRCVFPDLRRKPVLSKPIKNFEPDTGIPSIETLIEYKYLDQADKVAKIADQILADTRGYASNEWTSFVYVIYETRRFRPESEWRHLLRACDIDSRTTVIVLSGEPKEDSEPGRS